MISGYVFISVDPCRENEVKDQLKKMKDIIELYQVHGFCDFIAKLKGPNLDTLVQTSLSMIKRIPGVNDIRISTIMKPREVKDVKKIV